MKKYPTLLLLSILILLTAGCKKKSFDPASKSQSDFIGTWEGTLTTFKNNTLMKETGNFLIYPEEGGTLLGGIIYLSETRVFKQFQFANGTLYFRVYNTDPSNPLCKNWNLSGYASFTDEKTIEIRISGNECGLAGSEFVDWGGSIVPSAVASDSLASFSFAKASNNWTYNVNKKNGDSCQLIKLIATNTGTYIFNGESTHTCEWSYSNIPLKWSVTPAEFLIQGDPTLAANPISIPIYAKPGVVYYTYTTQDTTTLTMISKDGTFSTPAGDFKCNQYRYTETMGSGASRTTRISNIWVDYHFGIIQHTVDNPLGSTDIKSETLVAKNFLGN